MSGVMHDSDQVIFIFSEAVYEAPQLVLVDGNFAYGSHININRDRQMINERRRCRCHL